MCAVAKALIIFSMSSDKVLSRAIRRTTLRAEKLHSHDAVLTGMSKIPLLVTNKTDSTAKFCFLAA